MDFNQLKTALRQGGKIPNLLIFTGPEKEVQLQYLSRIDKNYKRADNLDTLSKMLTRAKLFKAKTTYVTENEKIKEYSAEQLQRLTKDNRLIIMLKDIDKRSAFYKQHKSMITVFQKFTEDQLVTYVKSKIKVDDQIAYYISLCCNNDVARIDNEIDKIQRAGQEPTVELVQQLITPPLEDAIFEMIDAIMQKNSGIAFEILSDMLELKESPIKIISILYTKVRQVFIIQSNQSRTDKDIATATGMNPYVVKMTRKLCNVVPVEKLVHNLEMIQEYEHCIKTGKLEQEPAIYNLTAYLLN